MNKIYLLFSILLTCFMSCGQSSDRTIQETIAKQYNFEVAVPNSWRTLSKHEKDSLRFDTFLDDNVEFMELYIPEDSVPNTTVENILIQVSPLGRGVTDEQLAKYGENDLDLELYKKHGLDDFVKLMEPRNRKCDMESRTVLMSSQMEGFGFIMMTYFGKERIINIKLSYTAKISDETFKMFLNMVEEAHSIK